MANKIKIAGTTSNTFTVGTNGTGNITAGNYLYSNGQALTSGSSSSTITIVNKTSNTVASTSDVGKMIVYSVVNGAITYDIPNVATANFSVGSRIEILADTSATIIIESASGANVNLVSKNLSGGMVILSNIQSATLTMISTDKWYVGP
jgi:hypothetical protein